jgi:GNAT superfamily N-acetyltransferase
MTMTTQGAGAVHIARIDRSNFESVLPLIADYQRFYQMDPSDDRNREFFSRYLDNDSEGILFGAFDERGVPRGFATLYFLPSSLSAAISCTFNDLYTVPEVRGAGVGVALGIHCLMYAKERGFKQVSWLTSPSNQVARQIYEYTNARCTDWCSYELSLEPAEAR